MQSKELCTASLGMGLKLEKSETSTVVSGVSPLVIEPVEENLENELIAI